jgi:XapX domain-containing protein
MEGLVISFVVGLLVGVVYGVIRVKSPAPPMVSLLTRLLDGLTVCRMPPSFAADMR